MMSNEAISQCTDPEMGLVVQLLRHRMGIGSVKDVEDFVVKRQPSAVAVVNRINERDIAGLVYIPNFSGTGLLAEVMERLKPEIAHRAGFNLVVYQRMREIQQLFAEVGLTPVFYKGLMLGMDIYGDLTTRFVSDIDVLIRKEDFPRMRRILLDDGYAEGYPYPKRYEGYYLEHTREAMFTKKDRMGIPVSVELQWAPMSKIYGLPDNDAYFLHYTMQKEMAGGRFTTVKPEQQILLMLIHHGIGDLWRSLRNVTDIAGFLKCHADSVDWKMVMEQLVAWKMYKNACIGMHLASRLFDAKIPTEFAEQPDETAMDLALDTLLAASMLPKVKKNFRNMYRQFKYLDDGASKGRLLINYIKTGIYPSMTDLNNMNLPRYLFPLYFLIKPFRFLPGFSSTRGVKRNHSSGNVE